jgi:hypothetical protein
MYTNIKTQTVDKQVPVGFEVFTAVTMKNAIFWDVALCISCVDWRFKFFYPEYGGDTFLQNVGSHKIYMVPHPRRRHSSNKFLFSIHANAENIMNFQDSTIEALWMKHHCSWR